MRLATLVFLPGIIAVVFHVNTAWAQANVNYLPANIADGTDSEGTTDGFQGNNGNYNNTDTSSGTFTSYSGVAWQGENSLYWQGSGNSCGGMSTVILELCPNSNYTFSVYAQANGTPGNEGTSTDASLWVYGPDNSSLGTTYGFGVLPSGWARHQVSFTTEDDGHVQIYIGQYECYATFQTWFDGFKLEDGSEATDWVEGGTSLDCD